MSDLICLACFKSKPEMFERLESELIKLVHLTRQEEGCVTYTLNYSAECKHTLLVVEHFKSKEDFEDHSQQPYLKNFIAKLPLLTERVSVQVCESVVTL